MYQDALGDSFGIIKEQEKSCSFFMYGMDKKRHPNYKKKG